MRRIIIVAALVLNYHSISEHRINSYSSFLKSKQINRMAIPQEKHLKNKNNPGVSHPGNIDTTGVLC